ncbi:MAG: ATP cone domain-containing protein [Candidatus Pacebacteria bacterium]|nr:ATP cone domain-containing protein [Candidatus Paceibacterota bacterium]
MAKTDKNAKVQAKIDEIMNAKVDTKKKTAVGAADYKKFIPKIQKRDGRIVSFEFDKVVGAIHKAMLATGEGSPEESAMVAHRVASDMVRIARKYKNFMPTVEGCQDEVERQLILGDYVATAKAYILYRAERAKLRDLGVVVPEHVKKLATESARYFKGNELGYFVYLRSYAKWIADEGRRETWIETVDRYMDFMKENLGKKLSAKEYAEVRETILKQEVMPSMRLMQFAGDAARKCNVCAYNCSYIAPTKLRDFGEVLYLSSRGAGVGFGVESWNVGQLPQIKPQTGKTVNAFVVPDSAEGWADALVLGMETWFEGKDISFDYSKVRPSGTRLKTMGGKASGPEPLRQLLDFTRERILSRQGRRLRNIDAHDILCKIGEAIVSGGVRRSAMISLSDLDDENIRNSKTGQFWLTDPQRALANNSAVYEEKPSNMDFMEEWFSLMKSQAGERGIFNRGSLIKQLPERRVEYLKGKYENDPDRAGRHGIDRPGTNPCGEIILQSKQFCNLSEVICRATDTEETLIRKVRVATILGTYQSTLTKFQYLSKEWTENCEAERLLGVSLTGQWDSKTVRQDAVLKRLKAETIKVNKKYSKKFGVNPSNAITAVKPSGTVSQTVNCASGMHPRHAPYYIRRIRISATDSLFKMLRDQGVPFHPEVGQTMESANTFVLEFPVKSPKGVVFKNDLSSLDQLKHWKVVKENYTEHNPSTTISVGDDEWVKVANWVYENWDIIGGLSFLPRSNFVYQLAPYEEITKEQYEDMVKKFENVDFSKLMTYELQDETEMKKELACFAGTCEI